MFDVDDLLNTAWTILCNVSEGDWSSQTLEWQEATIAFRERYHAYLNSQRHPVGVDEMR